MKRAAAAKFSSGYKAGLTAFLESGAEAPLEEARGLAMPAVAAGLHILDLAKLHEETLLSDVLPTHPSVQHPRIIQRAAAFFAAAITPDGAVHPGPPKEAAALGKFVEALSVRTVELAASNRELALEIAQRKAAERALMKSKRHYATLLGRSDRLQAQLRGLSRQILSAQEDERRRISRELHDVIAQTLTGINMRLATLKKDAMSNTKGLDRKITLTQQLVEKSVNLVHQFARELRPAVLDDLGLIPALQSYMKLFTARTGTQVGLTAFAEVEALGLPARTALFRVAQEALTNVSRHAKATRADVTISKEGDFVAMSVRDDGKSFDVERAMQSSRGTRLGLLGMRERIEMFGGKFSVLSTPGVGTTVRAEIPMAKPERRPPKQSLQ